MGFHNKYDGHTLKPVLEQVGRWTGKSPKKGKVNKGYRGRKQINRNRNTKTFASKNIMGYCQQKMLAIHIKNEQLENPSSDTSRQTIDLIVTFTKE